MKHLTSLGMVDVGSSFDIPAALRSMHRILDDEVAPVFRSGCVSAYGPAQDDVGVGPHHVVHDVLLNSSVVSAASSVPPTSILQPSSQISPVFSQTPAQMYQTGTGLKDNGILPTPPEFNTVRENYLGVHGSGFGVQQTPPGFVNPAHPYNVPPPPVKQVSVDDARAVKSVFQSYARCAPPKTGVVTGSTYSLPYPPQQHFLPRTLFPNPLPNPHVNSGNGTSSAAPYNLPHQNNLQPQDKLPPQTKPC